MTQDMLTREPLDQRVNPGGNDAHKRCTNMNIPCERMDSIMSLMKYI